MAEAPSNAAAKTSPDSWLNLPFDPTTNFSLLGYLAGRSEGDQRLDLALDE